MIDQEKWTLVLTSLNELGKGIRDNNALVKATGDALSVEIELMRKKVSKLARRKVKK